MWGRGGAGSPWYLGGEREEVAFGDVRIALGLHTGTLQAAPGTRDVRRGTWDVRALLCVKIFSLFESLIDSSIGSCIDSDNTGKETEDDQER